MNAMRQDAWTDDEDIILAETVLQHIREGKTQLEAFGVVAKQLTRTPAACGFRWNAAIRKQYKDQISIVKEMRKQSGRTDNSPESGFQPNNDKSPIEAAISLLEKMKTASADRPHAEADKLVSRLKKENEQLRNRLARYDDAWKEMGNLWKWVNEQCDE
jgi:RsfA family transcription factor